MPDLANQFSSPVQILRQIHSFQKVSFTCDIVDPKRRTLGSLVIHPASPPYSHNETAPLLGPPSKPGHSGCRPRATQPDDFRPIRLISQGVSGKVYLVEDKVIKKNFALKVIRKRSSNLSQVVNEKDALCKVTGNPWFLSLEASIHDDTNFYLVTPSYRTDLRSDLHLRGGHMPVELARFYMSELVCALENLHSRGIIHRDIKPANVLLTNDGHVVLADFGMAKIFPRPSSRSSVSDHNQQGRRVGRVATNTGPSGAASIAMRRPFYRRGIHSPDDGDVTREKLGTLAYAAPEVRIGLPYSFEVDFWSLGVLFYVMLTGRYPFGAFGEHYTLRFEPVDVDDGAQALLEKMLDINPSKRPNIDEIRAHRFFSSVDWEATAARKQPAPSPPRIPTHPPPLKAYRIPFGTPYDAASSNNDPIPDFTFTSSKFRKLRCETVAVPANTETPVPGLFRRVAVKVGMWCTLVASLLSSCGGC